MPPIRALSCDKNTLKFTDRKGIENKFDVSDIPQGKDTIQKLENYLNDEWLPPLLGGEYQMKIHIFTLSPLDLTAYSANLGEKVPLDWWSE